MFSVGEVPESVLKAVSEVQLLLSSGLDLSYVYQPVSPVMCRVNPGLIQLTKQIRTTEW